MKLFNPELFSEISRLELFSRKIVDGFLCGFHQSSFRGYNVEFADHKSYEWGDDLKTIDWKLYGRTDRLYVKRFHEETNMRAFILLDSSASMRFGQISKWHYANFLSAALSFLMLKQKDSVGIWLFNEGLKQLLPPRNRQSHFSNICSFLESKEPGSGTFFGESIQNLARNLKKRSLIILVSDLLGDEEQIFSTLKYLSHKKHEVIVFHVMAHEEVELPYQGYYSLVDSEKPDCLDLDIDWWKKLYQENLAKFRDKMLQFFIGAGIDYVFVSTKTPVEMALFEFLKKRRRGRGHLVL
ncbi:MAG: DUF58 domain-containing protein [Candidatus Wallbacteria bacterium]|nr:DUF58 domain-containing protein [Candidatus Wallbacteria bacterium]